MRTGQTIPLSVCLLTLLLAQYKLAAQYSTRPANAKTLYKIGKLIIADDFTNMDNWQLEMESAHSRVHVAKHKLIIDVDAGATIWLNKSISGNLLITYKRKVVVKNGPNDRLSDVNQFWMATDIRRTNLFTRSGVFSDYDFCKCTMLVLGVIQTPPPALENMLTAAALYCRNIPIQRIY